LTATGAGRPTSRYTGMSNDVYRRVDEHGRGEPDNISSFMHQAHIRGIDTRVRYAEADSRMEARAQELFLLSQRNYDWNSQNNGNTNSYWYR
jgi:predicted GIY-YIG superfamily endonuclease